MSTPARQQMPDADDFLMGGGGAPTAKFAAFGSVVTGSITQKPTVEQQREPNGDLKFYSDGNAMKQLVVTVQTSERSPEIQDDDGRRRLFVKGAMKEAIANAVKSTGAPGLEVGGVLTVTYTHDGQVTQRGYSAPKQYTAHYVPAATAELHAPDPGGQAPAPQYAAAPAAQPAPAPAPSIPGLTAEQVQAAMQNPATAALLAQQAAAAPPGALPPF